MKASYFLCNEAYLFVNSKEGVGKGRAVELGLITKSGMQMLALQWAKNTPESSAANSCGVMMSLMTSDFLFKALERSLTENLCFKFLD